MGPSCLRSDSAFLIVNYLKIGLLKVVRTEPERTSMGDEYLTVLIVNTLNYDAFGFASETESFTQEQCRGAVIKGILAFGEFASFTSLGYC